ncbi:helitron_like_N domain-containing protein [Caerostris darwini]|uniref:Helitron_like_N domain-containing protein n=1 Tax=Caerostris darwini TaxID=1538125 RepID=A0AAV4TWQ8_9ARAC|nr:helitron_like_N domain-containing protein [Caerostris darwini]
MDALLNEQNELLKLFKSHTPKLLSDNHAIVIKPDKTPDGEHIRRFIAPVVDDVAGIMVGDRTASRQIVIRRRGAETNKNVSSEDYYAYRLIRLCQDNVILRWSELCQQFMVDMYVKIESERLRYLHHNQQKLRAEEYIHLRDAIANNADTAEIGRNILECLIPIVVSRIFYNCGTESTVDKVCHGATWKSWNFGNLCHSNDEWLFPKYQAFGAKD